MSNFTGLARDYILDIGKEPNVWLKVVGIFDFNPQIEAEMQDDTDYDSEGWKSETKTVQGGKLEVSINRKRDVETYEHPESQEILRLAALGFREDNQVPFRYYDRLGGPEGHQGVANVQWEKANGGVPDLDAAKITLTTTGPVTPITELTNPVNENQKPVIAVTKPATVPLAGGVVVLRGNRFINVSGVTVDSDAAPYQVINNNTIALVAPADTAGTVPIVVTNAAGASDAASLTYSA